ncbi:MAG: 23S rRNA (pseudouridine(1915)-N(3))-methyltransferase RlmH [Chthoniobacteraceae bacterium]
MRWHIITVGKPKLAYARLGAEEYLGRIQPMARVTMMHVKASNTSTESVALIERSKGMFRIVLDERGDRINSRQLASRISDWEMQARSQVALLIGGADGHADALRAAADWTWSLSPLTIQHELALVVALEQIYRAYTIKAGLPYHRD